MTIIRLDNGKSIKFGTLQHALYWIAKFNRRAHLLALETVGEYSHV